MKQLQPRLRSMIRDEQGQVLPLMAVIVVMLMGMMALSIDFGRAYMASRSLQSATDAEALAGAQALPLANAPSDVYTASAKYTATPGNLNASAILTNVVAPNPTLKCLQTLVAQNMFCVGTMPYNAVQASQSMTMPMYFAAMFGKKTLTLSATSTAAAYGGVPRYANIAVVMDSTLSMNIYDANCSATQMNCSLNGVNVLLQHLAPCPVVQGNCTPASAGKVKDSVQRISLFTFPNVTVDTAQINVNCTTPVPNPTMQNGYWNAYVGGQSIGNYVMPYAQAPSTATVVPWSKIATATMYSFPAYNATTYNPGTAAGTATYQITDFLSDYKTSAQATSLTRTSDIVQAVGGTPGCGTMLPSNYDGVVGTYYAGAIYAAQASLRAQQAANPGSENIMIVLGDGDSTSPQYWSTYNVMPGATASGNYPSYVGECGQAVDAADYASAAGTTVYSVAYGSPQTGCNSDLLGGKHPFITPCQTMSGIASNPHFFYSDFNQTGSYSNCDASQPVVSLADIFLTIAESMTSARLVPNAMS